MVPENPSSDIAITGFGTVRTNDTGGFAPPATGEESVTEVPVIAVKYVPGVIRFTAPITSAPNETPVTALIVPVVAPFAAVSVGATTPFPIMRVPPNTVIGPDP